MQNLQSSCITQLQTQNAKHNAQTYAVASHMFTCSKMKNFNLESEDLVKQTCCCQFKDHIRMVGVPK